MTMRTTDRMKAMGLWDIAVDASDPYAVIAEGLREEREAIAAYVETVSCLEVKTLAALIRKGAHHAHI